MFKAIDKHQWKILIVLALINFLNYLDRQVIFPLFGLIKAEFHLSDFQLGLLGSVFLLTYSFASVPLGIAADRCKRNIIIAGSVAFWSAMSFFSGLAWNFRSLLGIRALVGVGEAGYTPAATAMITDNFPPEARARAQGIFSVGMFVGGTLGAVIGGIIAFYFQSWRVAFFLVSPPGLILALWALRLVDRQTFHHRAQEVRVTALLGNPALLWIILSGTLVSFSAGAYITWGVEFIHRYKHYNLRDAGIILGSTLMVAGVVGVLAGSWLADWLQRKVSWGRSIVVGVSLIISAPLVALGLVEQHTQWLFFVYFFLGTMLMSVYHGPVISVLHDVVPRHMRATAFAFYVLIIHFIGETIAPAVVGKISDHTELLTGLLWATGTLLLSGLTFLPVSWLIKQGRVALYTDNDVAVI